MKKNLKFLDGLRGIAAFYILVHHARVTLTMPHLNGLAIHPEKYEWYDKLMVYLFGFFKFGQEAVILFFVLSGFMIHLRQTTNIENFKLNLYLKKRVVRIYPTLITSFLLCVLVDYLIYLFSETYPVDLFSKYDLKTFLFNFFLIPETNIWGNNFPVWSLEHEWYFYLFYPLLLWLSKKNSAYPMVIALLFYCSYIFGIRIPYFGAVAYTLLIWSLGSALAVIFVHHKNLLKKLPFLLLLLLIYPFLRGGLGTRPIVDLSFGLMVVGALAFLLAHSTAMIDSILLHFQWLGKFSYSIYLLHFPLLNLFAFIVLDNPNQHPYHLWYVLIGSIVIMPIIYFIYYFTERIALNYKQKAL